MSGMTFQQLSAAFRRDMIYWGVSTTPANTEAFIEALAGKMAAVPRYSVTFAVTASGGNKIYFAMPDRFGTASFMNVADSVIGGFILRASTISVTDTGGVVQGYSLYESTLAGLGGVTLTASW